MGKRKAGAVGLRAPGSPSSDCYLVKLTQFANLRLCVSVSSQWPNHTENSQMVALLYAFQAVRPPVARGYTAIALAYVKSATQTHTHTHTDGQTGITYASRAEIALCVLVWRRRHNSSSGGGDGGGGGGGRDGVGKAKIAHSCTKLGAGRPNLRLLKTHTILHKTYSLQSFYH